MILFLFGFSHLTTYPIGSILVAFAVLFLWAVLHMVIHEIGHILAAWMVGSRIKQVGIGILGPFVRRTPAKTPARNAFVALAGPGTNILTWLVFVICGLPHAWVALYIGVLNLLPLPHSDFLKSVEYLRSERRAS
jgi:membrane-associated protease RseP (regulator of RpoE activity)